MPIVSTEKMTARQFLQMGEDPPGVRLELVDGEIAVSASPQPPHSFTALRLSSILDHYIEENSSGILLSDCDTVFGEYDVRRPDILYFAPGREHLIPLDDAIRGAPDLCIEVLSKKTKQVDRVDKFKQYAKEKVKYYWIVDPRNRTVEAFKLVGKSYREAGRGSENDVVMLPPFPDLKIALSRLWLKETHNR